jgi:transposase InsO family protein
LPDENELTKNIIDLACNYGRHGYRTIAGMLSRQMQKRINHKRVYRIWRENGLKVPQKQHKRGRLFLSDGSCVRLRAEHKNHVWSYDFMEDRTMNGRKLRFLNIIDEYTRECLTSIPRHSWRGNKVTEVLADLFLTRGIPEYIRSDNGPEFTKKILVNWLQEVGVITTFIVAPGKTASAKASTPACEMNS